MVTILSAIRVSRLPTARVTTSAPMALLHTASTSRPPITAAITRPYNGTIMGLSLAVVPGAPTAMYEDRVPWTRMNPASGR